MNWIRRNDGVAHEGCAFGGVRRADRAPGALLAGLVLAAGGPGLLAAQEFHVATGAPRMVRFISQAPIEDFEGVTEKIDGYVLLPEGGLRAGPIAGGSEFVFEVDLASLETGIGLRNRHMRDNYLETEQFPYAVFTGQLVRVEGAPGGAFRVTASGQMEIHGVKRPLEIPCDVAREGTGHRVNCAWSVRLPDYDIRIPRLMFMKINEEIRLEVDFAVLPAETERS